ncbi:MAG: L,D-transpeptidase family protein [Nocardiopsaceae bacterium]|nr:L,D-transpeptidase family protein [Nocardiopsaceae bacterium]
MSFWGRLSRQAAVLAGHREIAVTGAAALLVVIAGGAYAGASGGHSGPTTAISRVSDNRTDSKPAKPAPPPPPKPLAVTSVSPGADASGVNGTEPITVTFADALAADSALPRLSPKISGSWQVSGNTATFTPSVGYKPDTTVTVTIPAGVHATGAHPRTVLKTVTKHFTTGSYSTKRLQQLLSKLGYLPFSFSPSDSSDDISSGDAKAQLSAAYHAPSGSLSWKGDYPSQLTSQWRAGEDNIVQSGAVRAFENDHGLTMDGVAGPAVWSALLSAVANHKTNPSGYTYALATQGGDHENLQVWHDGSRILDTPANTGIAEAPTQDGTYPVYERLDFQYMQGRNPDGSKYKDPVHWIAYFHGGDAVHGFDRASYGSYQSLGCVELPVSTAKWIWPYLTYGTLVTVQGPVA